VSDADGRPPLARLFAIAYRQLVDDLHRRLRQRGWHDVRPAYGFVLLAARDAPVTVTGLVELLGMTKQAASKLADAMVSGGYLERGAASEDARVRPFELSDHGRRLLHDVEQIYAELDALWAARIGADRLEQLRADLRAAVAGPDGVLPAVRPLW
jgi:DNA-binding MarR family transcriptional regulator